MDQSEILARDHLIFRGFANPVYEPDGNVPPDFLLDGRIAVEVRRLNENERDSPSPKGLEETEIPLLMGIQKLAKSFGSAPTEGWWLRIRYGRPFPPWRELAKPVSQFLEKVRDGHLSKRLSHHFDDNLELDAIPRIGTGGDMFHLAAMTDEDSGGWELEELERNLRLCIDDKSCKTSSFRSRYPEWWLLLLDQVSYGLTEFDRAQFKQQVAINHDWARVIIVNPLDYMHYFEL